MFKISRKADQIQAAATCIDCLEPHHSDGPTCLFCSDKRAQLVDCIHDMDAGIDAALESRNEELEQINAGLVAAIQRSREALFPTSR